MRSKARKKLGRKSKRVAPSVQLFGNPPLAKKNRKKDNFFK